jgi:hypothetical protein
MCITGKYVAIPDPFGSGMCLQIPLEVSFWIQKIFCQRSYMGMLVLTYDASVMHQDQNLFLPEVDSKDPVVSVHHQHTPAIGYLVICTT